MWDLGSKKSLQKMQKRLENIMDIDQQTIPLKLVQEVVVFCHQSIPLIWLRRFAHVEGG